MTCQKILNEINNLPTKIELWEVVKPAATNRAVLVVYCLNKFNYWSFNKDLIPEYIEKLKSNPIDRYFGLKDCPLNLEHKFKGQLKGYRYLETVYEL